MTTAIMELLEIKYDTTFHTWTAHINTRVDDIVRGRVLLASDISFQDCLAKAQAVIARGPEWRVRAVYDGTGWHDGGGKCLVVIEMVGVRHDGEKLGADTMEEALANGRAECARRNAT